MIPSRERPGEYVRACESVQLTSDAKILGYLDEGATNGLEVHANPIVGPRVGCAMSMNALAAEAIRRWPEVDTLTMMTDDAIMTTPGWDEWAAAELDKYPGRLGVVSPHLSADDGAHRVDMPTISKELFLFLGWYAEPRFIHYFWPGVLDAISEGMCLTKARKGQFCIHHGNISPERERDFNFDAVNFGKWYAWDKATLRLRLEKAIKPLTYHSDNGMDARLVEIFGDFIGHACDVGANDGIQLSNSYTLEGLGWKVLCVEPNPLLAEEGRKNRGLWVECAAGAEDLEEADFSLCSPGNKWASASSLGLEPRGGGMTPERVVKVKVRKLDRLLEEAGFTKLDLLTVDVEGWEREVLAGFSVERWKPRVIVLEAWTDADNIEIPGYDIVEKRTFDNLYIRRDS